MKQSKKIIIVFLGIGIISISTGIILMFTGRKKTEPVEPSPSVIPSPTPTTSNPDVSEQPEEPNYDITISVEDALNIINNVFRVEGCTIDFKEEVDDYYVFEQRNSGLVVVNVFRFNKKTGEIQRDDIPIDIPSQ